MERDPITWRPNAETAATLLPWAVGPGAGKSTLLKTIIGFIPLFGGRIWFDGKNRTAERYTAKVRAGFRTRPPKRPSSAI